METMDYIRERKINVIDALEAFIINTVKGDFSNEGLEVLPETVRVYNELLNSFEYGVIESGVISLEDVKEAPTAATVSAK